MGFKPEQLTNTRIHQVLEKLVGIEAELTKFLVQHPRRRGVIDTVVYLDITDTFFVGRGADLAKPGKMKTGGIHLRRIQIALGVDAQGYPLRWEVIPGNAPEAHELPKWIAALDQHSELRGLPVVFDKGFNSAANLRALIDAGRRFVTCAKKPRLADWAPDFDFNSLTQRLGKDGLPTRKRLEKAGLTRVDDDTYYLDQGVRAPPNSDDFPKPGLRAVLFFRRTRFRERLKSIERKRTRIRETVEGWNEEMRNARNGRREDKTRKKVDDLLKKNEFQFDFSYELEPIEVRHGDKSVHSFQIHLRAIEQGTRHRDINAGWNVLLAHPGDERSADQLIHQYDHKAAVEYCFKTIKSFVELHPIRHQTRQKIETHVTLCMLALALDRTLEQLLREAGVHDSVDRVYEALEPHRLLELRHPSGAHPSFVIASTGERRTVALLEALGMMDLASVKALARA